MGDVSFGSVWLRAQTWARQSFLNARAAVSELRLAALERRKRKRREKSRFPTRWVSFGHRLEEDIEARFSEPTGKEFFNQGYVEALDKQVSELESWQIRLFLFQMPVVFFLYLSIFSKDTSISFLGLSVKNAVGLREALVCLSGTVSFLIGLMTYAKETRIRIISTISMMGIQDEFKVFKKFSLRSSFHSNLYLTQPYARYLFATKTNKVFKVAYTISGVFIVGALFFISLFLHMYILKDIFAHPTLPAPLTYFAIFYALVCDVFGLLGIVILHMPLPYVDKHVLQELGRLEKTDPAAYRELLAKTFDDD